MLHFSELCIERPLGTEGNAEVTALLSRAFNDLGYNTIDLPIDCTVWQPGASFVEQKGNKTTLFPSPFSKELKGSFPVMYAASIEELQNIEQCGGILIFHNDLSKAALMPRNFPFYFPDEDKLIYDTLEKINPKGIIAITGQDPASGLDPFPIFEDVNLAIPTAYTSSLDDISMGENITIEINSKTYKEKSRQLVFRKEGLSKKIILIAAHIDSKYFTNGAIDNASGLFALYETAKLIKDMRCNHTIEIVPFNGEESPEVSGQLAYLDYLSKNNVTIDAVINIDGVGHKGSKNMASFFNVDDKIKNTIIAKHDLLEGGQWYSGDHAMFAFQGIPCIALTSSDMFTDALKVTHTKHDTAELVDISLLETLSQSVQNIIETLDQ